MDEKRYTIGQVCELLNIKPHILRYWDKVLDLEIKRDDYLNRSYGPTDLEMLKTVKTLSDQGVKYKSIKNLIKQLPLDPEETETSDQIIEEVSVELEKYGKDHTGLLAAIESIVQSSMEKKLIPKIQTVEEKIDKLTNHNDSLKRALEEQQERHFKEIDAKLTRWREENMLKRKRTWLQRLLKL